MKKVLMFFISLIFLSGIASAAYYSSYYTAPSNSQTGFSSISYGGSYSDSVSTINYPNSNDYFTYPPMQMLNYHPHSYYPVQRVNTVIYYSQPHYVYKQLNCNDYYVGHQCVLDYIPQNYYHVSY